jgi:hypothetical protein
MIIIIIIIIIITECAYRHCPHGYASTGHHSCYMIGPNTMTWGQAKVRLLRLLHDRTYHYDMGTDKGKTY